MAITLNFLSPEEEALVQAQAAAEGMSVKDWLRKIACEHIQSGSSSEVPYDMRAQNLSELLLNSPFAGANLDLERRNDYPRPVDLG